MVTLFKEWLQDGSCSCGNHYRECTFWREVWCELSGTFPDLDFSTIHRTSRCIEAVSGYLLSTNGVAEREFYAEVWRTIIEAISRVSGRYVIVDSSKTTRGCARRVQVLSELCGFRVKVIHLVRDPRAVMWSVLRGSLPLPAAAG